MMAGKNIPGKAVDKSLLLKMKESELLELVSTQLKKTLAETKHVRQRLDKTLSMLQGEEFKGKKSL